MFIYEYMDNNKIQKEYAFGNFKKDFTQEELNYLSNRIKDLNPNPFPPHHSHMLLNGTITYKNTNGYTSAEL